MIYLKIKGVGDGGRGRVFICRLSLCAY